MLRMRGLPRIHPQISVVHQCQETGTLDFQIWRIR